MASGENPKVMRPMFKSLLPDSGVVGTNIAGTVEAVGSDVTDLSEDDEVFGSCQGAFAEPLIGSRSCQVPSEVRVRVDGLHRVTALSSPR